MGCGDCGGDGSEMEEKAAQRNGGSQHISLFTVIEIEEEAKAGDEGWTPHVRDLFLHLELLTVPYVRFLFCFVLFCFFSLFRVRLTQSKKL